MQPPGSPLRTLADSRAISFGESSQVHRDAIAAAFGRAEVGLCSYSLHVSVARGLTTDFRFDAPNLTLNERIFASSALLHLHIRHAVELALWRQLCPAPRTTSQGIATVLLAAFTTREFYRQMLTAPLRQLASHLPEWLLGSMEMAERDSDEKVIRHLATRVDALLALQGRSLPPGSPMEEALAIAVEYSCVARPTELTLTLQGDERLLIDPCTGLNKYGCSSRPRPEAITFSSCTASSVSEFAFREAELLRQRLMATLTARNLPTAYDAEMETIRTGVHGVLEVDPAQTQVILSASGTDAELYPLFLFQSPARKRLVNIIVAPDEVGSGTVLAAGGQHFSSVTPNGSRVRQGEGLADLGAESLDVVCIPIRESDGSSLSTAQVHSSIISAVTEADQRADIIILHVVDNTKTGLVLPDIEFVRRLHNEYHAKLRVVVDACQFRLERGNLHRYLAMGFSILITGSKFFTGPPFSGAFLVPKTFEVTSSGAQLPRSFAEYFTQSELPESLRARAQNLPATLNLGLLFRWTGALHEMRCFYSVPPGQRTLILESFRNELIASIRDNLDLDLLESVVPARWSDADQSLWDALPTIFSFAVFDRQSDRPKQYLSTAALKIIYVWLNRDGEAQLPPSATDEERRLAAQRCHIGQPVTIARTAEHGETGALRIACGARLVYGITYDEGLGKDPAERFCRELSDAGSVLAKVSLILKYWDVFNCPA